MYLDRKEFMQQAILNDIFMIEQWDKDSEEYKLNVKETLEKASHVWEQIDKWKD